MNLPIGVFRGEEDDAAARRKRLAEALRNNDEVLISSTGKIETAKEAAEKGEDMSGAQQLPEGKLA